MMSLIVFKLKPIPSTSKETEYLGQNLEMLLNSVIGMMLVLSVGKLDGAPIKHDVSTEDATLVNLNRRILILGEVVNELKVCTCT